MVTALEIRFCQAANEFNVTVFRVRSVLILKRPPAAGAVYKRRREEPLPKVLSASTPTDGIYDFVWNIDELMSQANDSPCPSKDNSLVATTTTASAAASTAASETESRTRCQPPATLPLAPLPPLIPLPALPCERVDVSIPLEQQKWYHGSIKRRRAESLLQQEEKFTFLVRNSEKLSSDAIPYIISMRIFSSHCSHIKIYNTEHGYSLERSGLEQSFPTVAECIDYYTHNEGAVVVSKDVSVKFQLKYSITRSYRFSL